MASEPQNKAFIFSRLKQQFIRSFISDTRHDANVFLKDGNQSVNAFKQMDNSAIKYFYLGETYIDRAVIQLKSGNYYQAAIAVKNGHYWLQKCRNEFPAFLPCAKYLALLQLASAHIVEEYGWFSGITGINANYKNELKLLESFVNARNPGEFVYLQKEAAFVLAYVYQSVLQKPSSALALANRYSGDFMSNPLSMYFATTFLYKNGNNSEALAKLEQEHFETNQFQIPFLYYLKGNCLLNKLQPEAAFAEYSRYLLAYKGNNYLKSTYLKMAWTALLQKNVQRYYAYMQLAGTLGNKLNEDDKHAMLEYERKMMPDTLLLKCRLLFDGGYIHEALEIIKPAHASQFSSVYQQTEYCYRKGRIYHALGQTDLALAFYRAAESTGRELPVYYAAYACLYSADIYSKMEDKTNARKYYEMALKMKNNREYRSSIELRAKAGLNRLN